MRTQTLTMKIVGYPVTMAVALTTWAIHYQSQVTLLRNRGSGIEMTWTLIMTAMTLQRVPGIPMGDYPKIEARNVIIENISEVSIPRRRTVGYRWDPPEQVLKPIGMIVFVCLVVIFCVNVVVFILRLIVIVTFHWLSRSKFFHFVCREQCPNQVVC